jgi:hypothetical protein
MRTLDRRAYLGQTLAAGSLAAVSSLAAAPAAHRSPPGPQAPWRKHGIVLPDVAGPVQSFTCATEPLDRDRWRLWFTTTGPDKTRNIGYAEGKPGEPLERTLAVLSPGEPADAPLAVGNLPADWRPVQVVHLQLNSGRHRIYFWAHGPRVVRYLVAESDDGRRYRVLDPLRPCLYHPNDRAVDGSVLAEIGLRRMAKRKAAPVSGERLAPARIVSNDATNVYQLPDGTFEMYSVGLVEVDGKDPAYVGHDNAAGWVRVIDRYASADGLDWTERRRVIVRDAADPADLQFYYLAVTHTPHGRLGMLGHYRCQAQTMDIEYCFSTDGINWQRPRRGAWITRGQPYEPDCYGIYAPHSLVERNGRWHLFYTGVNGAHNHKHAYGRPTQQVLYASTDGQS